MWLLRLNRKTHTQLILTFFEAYQTRIGPIFNTVLMGILDHTEKELTNTSLIINVIVIK